jgi:hypothetical protein
MALVHYLTELSLYHKLETDRAEPALMAVVYRMYYVLMWYRCSRAAHRAQLPCIPHHFLSSALVFVSFPGPCHT